MENEIYGSRVLVDPDPGGVGPPLLRLVVDLCCPLVVGCINRLILNFRCTLKQLVCIVLIFFILPLIRLLISSLATQYGGSFFSGFANPHDWG